MLRTGTGRRAHRLPMETNSAPSTVALITGGGRGIGRMVAVDLARAGVAVGVIARSESELAETATLVYAAGGVGWAAMADVTDASDLRKAIGVIRRALGPIDLLSTTPESSARSARCGRSTPTTGGRPSTSTSAAPSSRRRWSSPRWSRCGRAGSSTCRARPACTAGRSSRPTRCRRPRSPSSPRTSPTRPGATA